MTNNRIGTISLVFLLVSASAPMTVLAGGVVATFAVTGNIGAPLSFPVLGVALALFTVGYAAMSRYVHNPGAFYAYISLGLSRVWGVAASAVALVSYNAIQIGLYGLFGAALAAFAGAHWHSTVPWWGWALAAWATVALLGQLNIDLSAKVVGAFLAAEVVAVVLFDLGAFGHPAGGTIAVDGLKPHNLFANGVGGVFAFGIAAFVGFESGAVYSREVKDPRRTVARATYAAIAVTSVLYLISAWALSVATGPRDVVARARDPQSGIPFSLMAAHFGGIVADIANLLLITSVFAALLSFHMVSARYTFALGHERVLPPVAAHVGRRTGAPAAGSLLQSLLALVTVVLFTALHRDPLTELFTWLSYVAAVGVLVLLIGTSLSVVGYFSRISSPETVWQRLVAPILAAVSLTAITVVTVANADSVLGTAKGSVLTYALPGVVGVAALVGLVWGIVIKAARPAVYRGIGVGGPQQSWAGGALAGLLGIEPAPAS
ncbi:APC family permease [Planosporangium thailandense]|uniref:APC family permease n=1 Tax=Planosporangium thailandense TaxID=765197 RepID=A0ABX0XZY0_9ACTN|nr:APC family permease [Planosporangium thailandense]